MIDVEVFGAARWQGTPAGSEVRELCERAAASRGVNDGHVALSYVEEAEIAALNESHRGRQGPTDVLSFPVDGAQPAAGPRELGDIVICPPLTADLREAIVHGMLHLLGMDHETDSGELLALQDELLGRGDPARR